MTGRDVMAEDRNLTREFIQFHSDNPIVYRVLVRLAREWVTRTGSYRLGVSVLYERARWEIAITTSDPNYKLNNNHRAYYSRLIMEQEPDLADMFRLRQSQADWWINRVKTDRLVRS